MVVKHRSSSDSYVDTLQCGKYSLPYGPELISKTSRETTQVCKLLTVVPALVNISILLAIFYSLYTTHTKLSMKDIQLKQTHVNFDYVENLLIESEEAVDSTHTSLSNLQSQLMNLLPGGQEEYIVDRGEEFSGEALYKKIIERQIAMKVRVNELQNTVSGLYRGEAIEHFGSEPHKLKFNLLIHGETFSFIVETAPLDLMPHSVHFFMEMVKAQVWDNTVVTYNLNHILAELRDSEGNDKRDLFVEKGISTLSFPEYNNDYPHHKYTLGLGGKPGGPSFYINTEDNREIHGPDTRAKYDLGEEADPCFARVIEGHYVIDWIKSMNKVATTDTPIVINSIRTIL